MAFKGDHNGIPGGTRIKTSWETQLKMVERLNVIFKGKDLRGKQEAAP